MGRIGQPSDPVTKTTNAILILPKDHLIVQRSRGLLLSFGKKQHQFAASVTPVRICAEK